MRRSDAERLEEMVRSLSKRNYWNFIGWLSNGGEGDLWEYLRPRNFPREADQIAAPSHVNDEVA
jgi:hypothetical protein